MDILNLALTRLFDALLWPFGRWPAVGLIVVSALAGILMLLVFKVASNQTRIRRSRDLINAHLLAMRLFQDDAQVLLASQKQVMRANLGYLRWALMPLIFIMPPVILMMAQLELRYGAAPLAPRESAVVKVVFTGTPPADATLAAPVANDVRIQAPPVVVETPPLHIPYDGEVDWRVKGQIPGRYALTITAGGRTYTKELIVGKDGRSDRVSAVKAASLWTRLLHPGEKGPGDGVKKIEVLYPRRENRIFGLAVSWVLTFFVVSMVAAFAFKGIIKAEI
jgi:uncharacterized membrane protein (DUF106 family)